ncbi:MAG: hypothetical protein WD771_02515 [Gemmatimonadaceae bacterium]
MSEHSILPLPPVADHTASPAALALLTRARREMMMVPNLHRMMAHAPPLLETYMDGYARFRRDSGFSPAEQEVAFLSISRENGCGYCVAAHSFLADARSGVPRAVTEAIREDRPVPDVCLGAVDRLVRSLVRTRGRPDPADLRAFVEAGFRETQVLDLVLAVAIKTMSNYTNHLCETEIDGIFRTREWRVFKAAQALKERLTG